MEDEAALPLVLRVAFLQRFDRLATRHAVIGDHVHVGLTFTGSKKILDVFEFTLRICRCCHRFCCRFFFVCFCCRFFFVCFCCRFFFVYFCCRFFFVCLRCFRCRRFFCRRFFCRFSFCLLQQMVAPLFAADVFDLCVYVCVCVCMCAYLCVCMCVYHVHCFIR